MSYIHGEAVAIGLCMAADLAVRMGELSPRDADRIRRTVEAVGLPTESEIDIKRLLKALRLDKKRDNDTINIVLPTAIGSCSVVNMSFEKLDQIMLS